MPFESPGFLKVWAMLNERRSTTLYEDQNGIRAVSEFGIVNDFGDVKLLEREKSDGTRTLAIIFKHGSGSSDAWICCIPTKNQIDIFTEKLKPHYDELEKLNEMAKAKWRKPSLWPK